MQQTLTLGLAVSVGGLASPGIGALADSVGLEKALLPLIALPVVAWLALAVLKDPRSSTHTGTSTSTGTGTGVHRTDQAMARDTHHLD